MVLYDKNTNLKSRFGCHGALFVSLWQRVHCNAYSLKFANKITIVTDERLAIQILP
jgi:hypothetical protein